MKRIGKKSDYSFVAVFDKLNISQEKEFYTDIREFNGERDFVLGIESRFISNLTVNKKN